MRSDDEEVLGVTYSYLTEPDYARRIQPPLEEAEIRPFLQHFMGRSFLGNPRREWAYTRYAARRDLVGSFFHYWNKGESSNRDVVALKKWLAHLYRSSDQSVRRAIVDATLEHLFENRRSRSFSRIGKETHY